jgi:hypothetical protein
MIDQGANQVWRKPADITMPAVRPIVGVPVASCWLGFLQGTLSRPLFDLGHRCYEREASHVFGKITRRSIMLLHVEHHLEKTELIWRSIKNVGRRIEVELLSADPEPSIDPRPEV